MSAKAKRTTKEEGCSEVLAALDLGSNSFHLLVARVCGTEVRVLDRERDLVQLAAGLDERGYLSAEAQERAIRTLERFRKRLQSIPAGNIWAVGTNTLRRAANGAVFLRKAQAVLDHPIEVISGLEEARLIYRGVVQAAGGEPGRRLVIDIGGGSTELILGEGLRPMALTSIPVGCVTFTRRFFSGGRITAAALNRAENAASRAVSPLAGTYGKGNWRRAVGSSGTVKAVGKILRRQEGRGKAIRAEALADLRQSLLDCPFWQQRLLGGKGFAPGGRTQTVETVLIKQPGLRIVLQIPSQFPDDALFQPLLRVAGVAQSSARACTSGPFGSCRVAPWG
jgi:exopolyphosphatase/guanosine-5'-triphosphate,3'-diphosphate pyrophosphatase